MPDTPFLEINPDPPRPNLHLRDQTENADQRQVATAPEIADSGVVPGDLMITELKPPDERGRMTQIERMRTKDMPNARRKTRSQRRAKSLASPLLGPAL